MSQATYRAYQPRMPVMRRMGSSASEQQAAVDHSTESDQSAIRNSTQFGMAERDASMRQPALAGVDCSMDANVADADLRSAA